MTATLRFTLPDENTDYHNAMHGERYRAVIEELDEWLRRQIKYTELPEVETKCFEAVRENLWRIRKSWEIPDD